MFEIQIEGRLWKAIPEQSSTLLIGIHIYPAPNKLKFTMSGIQLKNQQAFKEERKYSLGREEKKSIKLT